MSVYCQRCQKEAACVEVTEVSKEGTKLQVQLCEECARSQGLPPVPTSSVLAVFKELMEKTSKTPTRDRQCPQCGMSFGEFKAKGRFGCAHDYEVFLSRVIPLLERIHGSAEHVNESEASEPAAATTAAAPSPAPAVGQAQLELKRLRRDLQRVIKNEEYEEAARIRDRIQNLEKQLAAREDGERG